MKSDYHVDTKETQRHRHKQTQTQALLSLFLHVSLSTSLNLPSPQLGTCINHQDLLRLLCVRPFVKCLLLCGPSTMFFIHVFVPLQCKAVRNHNRNITRRCGNYRLKHPACNHFGLHGTRGRLLSPVFYVVRRLSLQPTTLKCLSVCQKKKKRGTSAGLHSDGHRGTGRTDVGLRRRLNTMTSSAPTSRNIQN